MKNFLYIFVLIVLIFITLSYEKAFIERTLAGEGEGGIQNHAEILNGSEISGMESMDNDVEKWGNSSLFKNTKIHNKSTEMAGQSINGISEQVGPSKKNIERKILLDTAYITTFGNDHESISFNY